MSVFQPDIIAFLCNWCSYEAADAAGRSQKSCPAGVKIIRVMCSGRVDPCHVLHAFQKGADGVIIMGCRPGECHYKTGNIQVLKRYALLTPTMKAFGVDKNRLRLAWIAAGESEKFIQILEDMTETLRRTGPLKRP